MAKSFLSKAIKRSSWKMHQKRLRAIKISKIVAIVCIKVILIPPEHLFVICIIYQKICVVKSFLIFYDFILNSMVSHKKYSENLLVIDGNMLYTYIINTLEIYVLFGGNANA